nr:MAG TPA: hypothetical protein [Caudoviricetes sp.]
MGKHGLSLFHLARTLYQRNTLTGCLPCVAVKVVVIPHLKHMMRFFRIVKEHSAMVETNGLVIITGYNTCFSL